MIIRYGAGIILLVLFSFFFSLNTVAQKDLGRIKCICIDAGHGGKDPGCVSPRGYEKNIVLSVALQVGKLIKEQFPDIKIVYTRDKDVFVELFERGKIANEHKADLFLSIHVNSVDTKLAKGVETYVLGLHKTEANLKVAMKENAVIKYEDDYSVKYAGFDPTKAESYIIFSMMQNLYLGNSLNIAGLVQKELIGSSHREDRSVRQAGYLVLKDVAMPAILIELGFLSNPEEERYLLSKEGQSKMAASIASAFQSYKESVEKNSAVLTDHHPQAEPEITGIEENEEAGEFFYAVQVASAAGKIKNLPAMETVGEVKEIRMGDRYRYLVAISGDYEKVRESMAEVRKTIRDCFIIAVHKGNLISLTEAKKIEKKLR